MGERERSGCTCTIWVWLLRYLKSCFEFRKNSPIQFAWPNLPPVYYVALGRSFFSGTDPIIPHWLCVQWRNHCVPPCDEKSRFGMNRPLRRVGSRGVFLFAGPWSMELRAQSFSEFWNSPSMFNNIREMHRCNNSHWYYHWNKDS